MSKRDKLAVVVTVANGRHGPHRWVVYDDGGIKIGESRVEWVWSKIREGRALLAGSDGWHDLHIWDPEVVCFNPHWVQRVVEVDGALHDASVRIGRRRQGDT